jgi:ABC-type glutathione transport system ATPase component
MGGSGAGKTTLMDVIAGRKTIGRTSGALAANGAPLRAAALGSLMGYVEQADFHAPLATVGEALRLAARLRLPAAWGRARREALVAGVMGLVELLQLEGNLVGTPGGGQVAWWRAAASNHVANGAWVLSSSGERKLGKWPGRPAVGAWDRRRASLAANGARTQMPTAPDALPPNARPCGQASVGFRGSNANG